MKQQTTLTRSRWLLTCLLSLLMTLTAPSSVWAAKTLPYSYGFEDNNLATDGWTKAGNISNSSSKIGTDYAKTGSYGYRFYYDSSTSDANPQCLISPELNINPNASNIKVNFYYKTPGTYGPESFKVGYSTTDTSIGSFTWDETVSTSVTAWTSYETSISIPVETKYVAIAYTATNKYYLYVDDINITCDITGPALNVADGATTIASGYNYSFGLATAGTTKTFTLSNPGSEAAPISVSHTGSFGAELSATSIPAGESVTLTVTMPDATGDDVITISSTSDAIDDFVINVSGTVRDPNKVYESGFTSLPDDWTTTGSWSYSAANGAYTQVWYLSSNARLITPKLTIAEGEKFFVEAKGYSTSNTSYQHLQMQYSADGSTWTNFDSEPSLDPNDWNTFEFTGAPAGNYYIAINASQADIRMFYGGELPLEPKMVVTEPASLDFGLYEKDASPAPKSFTIANTGKATLNGISVTSANAAFAITDAPTSLAAGEDAEVTITMSTATAGALSSLITISATDMADASFTVTGAVKPTGMPVEDFSGTTIPSGWTSTGSWNFTTDGVATGTSGSAYLYTPKLKLSDGDFIIIKCKNSDGMSGDYLTITGSTDNGSSYPTSGAGSYNRKLDLPSSNTEWSTFVVTDIPTTVNKIRFTGGWVIVDEIHGLTYAPVLSVTKDEAVVNTPAAYDFGECAANASVTYNFANAGAGTINITGVVITGDGAAAYSTNWTESVATPFDLTITRTYDAERAGAGAQEAVVTVTTSEGDFVINVTGSDKAANAPELSVSTNSVNFGKVTADAVETVTVTNNGTGSMTVNIASDSEDFEVSATSLTGIGAGESKTFDVTFKYGTPYGVKNGNVTVTPTYDAEAAQVITVTGKAKDPATWSEDFSGGVLPAGWEAGTNWTIADGKAKGAYAYSSTTYLTTAPLTVSGTTDEMSFDYEATSNYVSIAIQKSKDGGDFEDLHTISGLNNGDAGSYTITGLEAGTYQFRFKNDDYQLDNFEGFVLNLPDHMMAITASSIPSSGLKEGQSFDASVTVKEKRGVAEADVVAKVYMGSTLIGTSAATAFTANESKAIVISCTPTEGGNDIEMHIEVEYAGGTLSTSTVTRDIDAITNLTLDETSSDEIIAGTYDNLTLKRNFTAGWNTVCLPFTISDVEAFFGEGAKAYNFTSYSEGTLGFTKVNTLTASYPYVVYVPAAITEDIELHNITIANTSIPADYRYQSGAYFRGTYTPIAAGGWTKNAVDDKLYGVTSAGKIAKIGDTATSKGFRGYFDLPAGASARLSFEDDATGITTIIDAKELNNDGKVYNLNGQRVENAHKGLYIVNGRKVVVK